MSFKLLPLLLLAVAVSSEAATANFSGVYPQEEAQFANITSGDVNVDLNDPSVMSTVTSGQPAVLVINYMGQPTISISAPTLSLNVPNGTTSSVAAHFDQNGAVNGGTAWSSGIKSKQLSSQYTSDTLYIDCEILFPAPPSPGTYSASVLVTSQ